MRRPLALAVIASSLAIAACGSGTTSTDISARARADRWLDAHPSFQSAGCNLLGNTGDLSRDAFLERLTAAQRMTRGEVPAGISAEAVEQGLLRRCHP